MTLIALANKHGAQNIREPYATDEQLGIAVNTDAFVATPQTDERIILIDNRNLKSLLIHFFNNAGTNGFDFEVSGHAKEVDAPPTLSVAPEDWHVLPNGTGTVTDDDSDAVSVTDDWAWIAIRLKRTSAGLNSIADIFIRGRK